MCVCVRVCIRVCIFFSIILKNNLGPVAWAVE